VYRDHELNWIVLKFVEDMRIPYLPILKCYWFYYRFSIYQAIGLASLLVIGIEISMGFDRSTSMFSIVAIIILTTRAVRFKQNITKLGACEPAFANLAVNSFTQSKTNHLLSRQSKLSFF
jgi:hypothetical protein